MRDRAYKKECAEKVKASRAKLAVDLKQLGFRLWDSQTNFILAQTPKGNAEQIYLALKERVILVATSSSLVREDKVRIKVGTDERSSDVCSGVPKTLSNVVSPPTPPGAETG